MQQFLHEKHLYDNCHRKKLCIILNNNKKNETG
jgi:hypothetical protein